jgi:hypothetical protein
MVVSAKNAAMVLGIVFIIAGALGFVPNNPIFGPAGIFMTNDLHNWIHIGSGVVLLLGVYSRIGPSLALKIIGVLYAIVAVLGFVLPMPDSMMLGMIAMNMADKWLHVVLAIVILYAGFGLTEQSKAAIA